MRRLLAVLLGMLPVAAAASNAQMQAVAGFEIDRTELSVGQFRRFAQATALVTAAERETSVFPRTRQSPALAR